MKKILFMSLLAGAFAFTACDPAQESVDNNTVTASESDLLNGISFTQYADEAMTREAADGNYIKYATNPGRQIQIFNYRGDGSMNLLASGASGSFSLKPGRGSDPNQPIFIRHLNSDGSVTTTETTLTVFVQQELDPAIKILASNDYGPAPKSVSMAVVPSGGESPRTTIPIVVVASTSSCSTPKVV